MEFLKKILINIGLSISLLIFTGLGLNILYPLINQPLSLWPVLIALNVIFVILSILDYHFNQENFDIGNIFNFKFDLGDKSLSIVLFPFIFPILAIVGTYIMNIYQNNVFIMLMFLLIPAYIVSLVIFKERVHKWSYPLSIWLVGLSLLLMHGLTSNHIIMGLEPSMYHDGLVFHAEYYCYQLTLNNFHWDINSFRNPYNACLSITIFPTILKVLTNINSEYIFKLYYGLIGSFIPLILYSIFDKYFKKQYALFAALLFTFQIFFILMIGSARQEIAILFFFLAVMVLFDEYKKGKISKKIIFLIFVFSTIVCHYSTSYVALTLLLPILGLPFLKSIVKHRKLNFENFDVIFCYLLFLLVWFILYANVQFFAGADVVASASVATSAGDAGNSSTRDALVLSVLGIGLKSLPNTLSAVVNDLIFLIMGIGLVNLLFNYIKGNKLFDSGYTLGIILSIGMLVMFLVFPSVSLMYGADRLFFQLLVFTAPLFILGVITVAKRIKKPSWKSVIFLILLTSLFITSNHLQYHFAGIPYSSEYDNTGLIRGQNYIYDQEIVGASWINQNGLKSLNVTTDSVGGPRLMLGGFDLSRGQRIIFDKQNTTMPGYLFMGYVNVREGNLYKTLDITGRWENYYYIYQNKSRIYDNSYVNIYL